MKQKSLPKTWILFFAIMCILVIGAILQSYTEKTPSTSVYASQGSWVVSDRQKRAEEMVVNGGNAVYSENQKAGETTVMIGFAVVADSGFVVIHEDNDGVPGKIIGSSALIRNRENNVIVQTSSSLQNGRVYYAILHKDNGDEKFSEAEDEFLNDKENDATLMSFLATE